MPRLVLDPRGYLVDVERGVVVDEALLDDSSPHVFSEDREGPEVLPEWVDLVYREDLEG